MLYIYWAGQKAFALLVVVVSVLALHEYLRMVVPAGRGPERRLGLVAGALLSVVMNFASLEGTFATLVLLLLGFSILFLFRFQNLETVVQHLACLLLGLIYVPLLLGHLTWLHGLEHGKLWIFFVMFLVMASDSLAYFSGMWLGRRKLYPAISPNKSVEGALGGLLGGILAALVVRATVFPALGLGDCLALGAGLGAASQLGDLFESMLKRSFGVKDSGTLIPGHGGLLDRLDSLLFAYPLAYYYALYLL